MALNPTSNLSKDRKKAAEDEVLMREIDDAVRQDQYSDFFARYGKPLIAAIVIGLLAFGGYLFWDNRNEAALEEKSEALVSAMDNLEANNIDTGVSLLEPLVDDSADGPRAIAILLKAGVAMDQGRTDEAAQLYARVAGDGSVPQEMRDLATIREVVASYDSLDPAEVVAKLKPLAVPGNAYFGSAGELVAMAYLEQGKRSEAGTLFAEIAKSDEVPESLRFRTRQMAGLMGVDAIEDVDEVLEDVAVDGGPAAPQQ